MGRNRRKHRSKASHSAEAAPNPELSRDEVLKNEGNKHFLAGDFEEAVRLYNEALEIAPENHKIWSNRCAANVGLATPESLRDAVSDAERCVSIAPEWAKGYFRKGVALRALGQGSDALAAFRQSAALDPANDEVQQALEDLGRLDLTQTDDSTSQDLEKPKFDSLTRWLAEGGAKFPNLYLRRYTEGHRGVHTRANVKVNEDIMSIPRQFLITVEMGKATELGQSITAANLDITAPKHCFLCAFVLVDRQNPRSFFRPYYDTLPASFPSFPVTWDDDQLAPLQGSYCINQVRNKRKNLEDDYEQICSVEPGFRRFASLEDFIWARLMVASRNFSIRLGGKKTDALVPLADMLNHYRPRETRWTFREADDAFVISSLRPLQMGNQVFDSYGKKCNSRFLLNYGFTVEDNRDEDGTCHNEVFIILDLPASDPQRETKAAMLDGVNSARGLRLSMHHDATVATREAFAYSRFISARGKDLMHFTGHFDDAALPPVSCENEARTLRLLATHCREVESGYPTTLEEDREILSRGVHPFGSNERNCVVMRACEKEVCRYYQRLAEEAIPLLESDWATAKRAIHRRFNTGRREAKAIEDYMQRIVARLVRTGSGK